MKNDTPEMKQRSATSTLFASFISALVAVPLCVAAGCLAQDDAATATKTQSLGASCLLRRPLGWSGVGAYCVESRKKTTSILLLDGESYFTVSSPGPGLGEGEVTMICHDGIPEPDPWDDICIPDHGGGGGSPQ